MAAEAAMERVHEEAAASRFEELRGKFVKWGGHVIFERSVGWVALDKLKAAERALVKREKNSTTLRYDIATAIDAAASATGMKWRALYNDYEVAQRVHKALGSRKIGFQWEHGPAPYVLHIHLDLSPRALDAPPGSGTP
ncbi:hypothetical protein [Myxococcus sp. RHSTA-1-4]|uniref:hypothetical protein n=1 Tax=Myxococcus sp. RHSTA-1-4 TaxID=2874601 RepID=UPI001CBB4F75|nr:hypothetical protein [Myxococcus sp. RHSTA-1-4]MBZ4416571.1 hypothetical protein [Myxococcus sp. RHSTA-1-4]